MATETDGWAPGTTVRPARAHNTYRNWHRGLAVGFEVHVRDMTSAASKLGAVKSPSLSAQGAPSVGGTDGASGYAADCNVWCETRKQDLKAADRQVDSLVAKIKAAARRYDSDDGDAREVFMKALDGGFEQIDR